MGASMSIRIVAVAALLALPLAGRAGEPAASRVISRLNAALFDALEQFDLGIVRETGERIVRPVELAPGRATKDGGHACLRALGR